MDRSRVPTGNGLRRRWCASLLLSALSDRAAGDNVMVIDAWQFDAPRTKDAITVLGALGLRPSDARPPRVLLVLDRTDEQAWRSFRNLGERVQIILPEELNAYDVLVNDWIVFSSATLEAVVSRLTDGAGATEESA